MWDPCWGQVGVHFWVTLCDPFCEDLPYGMRVFGNPPGSRPDRNAVPISPCTPSSIHKNAHALKRSARPALPVIRRAPLGPQSRALLPLHPLLGYNNNTHVPKRSARPALPVIRQPSTQRAAASPPSPGPLPVQSFWMRRPALQSASRHPPGLRWSSDPVTTLSWTSPSSIIPDATSCVFRKLQSASRHPPALRWSAIACKEKRRKRESTLRV